MTKIYFARLAWILAAVFLGLFLLLPTIHIAWCFLATFFCALGLFTGFIVKEKDFKINNNHN